MKGRGSVNASTKHPLVYLGPIRTWFNSLKWKARNPDNLNTPTSSVTFLEAVVDFELTMGIRIGDTEGGDLTWPQKAKRLAYYLRLLARVNGVQWNGVTMTQRQALRPTTDATSLTPLGGPMMSGMGRRPVWTDRRTPRVAALNTWKAKEEQSRTTGSTKLSDRRTRKFAEEWQLQMQGHKAQSRIRATTAQLMREPRSLLARDSQESQAAADRQSQRQPTRTIDRPKRERDADIDPHIPLPKLTREQKAEGTSTEVTRPDSGIRTPNSTPNYTEATKRKAQSQHEGASGSKKRNNHASNSNDPDESTEAHESSSTPKESESPKTKGRKRMAANQLDDERSPHIRESEGVKNRWKKRDPGMKGQTGIASNSSMREDTEFDMSRGSKRTINGVQTNSDS